MFEKTGLLTGKTKSALGLVCKLSLLAAVYSPLSAFAQETNKWEYRATIYGYLPEISGKTSFPAGAGGSSIGVSAEQILDSLEFTFMGTIDMHNGRWGLFSDLIYLDVSASKSGTKDFTLSDNSGSISIPGGTTADISAGLKGTIWTTAGQYRVVSSPTVKMDVLAGARMFKIKSNASWNINGSLGPWTGARSGSASVDDTLWDGIVGVKGNAALGNNSAWSVPFYFDVGTGESDLTWQAATGISYAFSWGEASLMYRYLDYNMKSGNALQDINFSGPMMAATFKF